MYRITNLTLKMDQGEVPLYYRPTRKKILHLSIKHAIKEFQLLTQQLSELNALNSQSESYFYNNRIKFLEDSERIINTLAAKARNINKYKDY